MARRRLMSEGASGIYDVGNIVWSNGVIKISLPPTEVPSGYRPIGIVVIPTSHDVYGDGSAGVMSLTAMSMTTPTTGADINSSLTEKQLYMGYNGSLAYNLPLRNALYVDGTKFVATGAATHTWNPFTDTNVPKPYLADGVTKNKAYFTQGNDIWGLDFGDSNHNILITKSDELLAASNYTGNWRSKTSFSNDGTLITICPAFACMCAEVYSTYGTSPGDWWAPTSGELVYGMCKWDELYNAIHLLAENYGSNMVNPFVKSGASANTATSLYVSTTASYKKSDTDTTHWPAPVSSQTGYLIGIGAINARQNRFYPGLHPKFTATLATPTLSMAFTKMKLQ